MLGDDADVLPQPVELRLKRIDRSFPRRFLRQVLFDFRASLVQRQALGVNGGGQQAR